MADCSESAYSMLSVSDAQKLMMYETEPDLLEHASQVQRPPASSRLRSRSAGSEHLVNLDRVYKSP